MNEVRMRIDRRAVALFVALDLVTFAVLYWLVVPAFAPVLTAIEPTTAAATGWVLSAVRLVLVGVVAARSYRRRLGVAGRSELVPTMLAAAGIAWTVQLVLGVLGRALTGMPLWSFLVLLDLVVWVGFALVAVLFVAPGEAERLPLRYREAAAR